MILTTPSLEKVLRDNFPRDEGLVVAEAARESLTDELKRLFDKDEWKPEPDSSWRPKEGTLLCAFRLEDPGSWYRSTTFHFVLDASNRLTVHSSDRSAPVGHLDEVRDLIQDCRQRLQRQEALRKRREKVRGFKGAAMLAQLKKLGREEGFDFVAEFNVARVKLWIRVPGDENTFHLYFPLKRFQEILPRLPGVVRLLREAYETGVSFQVATPRSLPWGAKWIRSRDDGAGK